MSISMDFYSLFKNKMLPFSSEILNDMEHVIRILKKIKQFYNLTILRIPLR